MSDLTGPEADAMRQLVRLGFKNIKITGTSGGYVGYTHTNGDPVMDGPRARVVGNGVELEPWTAHLDG